MAKGKRPTLDTQGRLRQALLGEPAGQVVRREGGTWIELGPTLTDTLLDPMGDGGPANKRPTLTVWWDGTNWHGSLHMRRSQAVTYHTSETLASLLYHFDDGLRTESLKWRWDEAF